MDDGPQDIFGRTIDVSNTAKVLFPTDGITKGKVVAYYARVAETMLAHVRGRPVALRRYPDGLDSQGFFQKRAGGHFPGWIRRHEVPRREDGTVQHVVIEEPATIVYLADQGTLEFHPWLSSASAVEHPDEMIFDLDPPDDDTDAAREAARLVRDALSRIGLDSRVKTTGSAGYHVHVRLDGSADFAATRPVAAGIAGDLAARYPDRLTDRQRKDRRAQRVFVDYLRNGYGQTAVAPYSLRARPGAPVATPLEWSELGRAGPRRYTIANLFRRLGQRDDPWRGGDGGQGLAQARKALDALAGDAG